MTKYLWSCFVRKLKSSYCFLGEGDGEHWTSVQDPCWSRRAARHSSILDTRLGETYSKYHIQNGLRARNLLLKHLFTYLHTLGIIIFNGSSLKSVGPTYIFPMFPTCLQCHGILYLFVFTGESARRRQWQVVQLWVIRATLQWVTGGGLERDAREDTGPGRRRGRKEASRPCPRYISCQ